MRHVKTWILPVVAIILLSTPISLFGWGFWAHKEIARAAIESLPAGLRPFFRGHKDSLIEKSVEPDQRRFADPQEGFTHFINIDRYGTYPFAELPKRYEEAVRKFGKGSVDSAGTVPWRIAEYTQKLTDAFRRGKSVEIVACASWLSHYVADAHVPLHATENYDGQLTNQRGIHARWESRIPEKFGSHYNFMAMEAVYIDDPLQRAFEIVAESYLKVDSVLAADREVGKSLPDEDRFVVRRDGNRVQYVYTDEYYSQFNRLLNGMVERRMNESVQRVVDYWYTAWVNAGKPELRQDQE